MNKRVWSMTAAALALAVAGCGAEADTPVMDEASTQPAAGAPTPAPADRQEVSGPARRILAFGDSLFAGYGIGVENSYPALLEDALRQRGINAVISNAAVSGETSGAGRQRLAFVLDGQENATDLVLLELGGNDMLRGLAPEETRANFDAMLGELTGRGIPVLLMGMRAPPNYGPEYQRAFDAIYAEMAEKYDVALVPFWLESIYRNPGLFQDDRIHPTREGIAALVGDTVDEVEAALPPAASEE